MAKLKIVADYISSVEDLRKGLEQLPSDTKLSPFGSSDCKLIYDEENKVAYLDDDFGYLDENDYVELIKESVERKVN